MFVCDPDPQNKSYCNRYLFVSCDYLFYKNDLKTVGYFVFR